jgi:hypothetical protein
MFKLLRNGLYRNINKDSLRILCRKVEEILTKLVDDNFEVVAIIKLLFPRTFFLSEPLGSHVAVWK